jgi:maltose alpha-D-glucosyltransferase/alpha-amylase
VAPRFEAVSEIATPWYKTAIVYELHVRSFRDSDANGTGDFAGLTEKLDYIQDLGATALWLLPFCPSPWRDDGYDVCDYLAIHPSYGTMDEFRSFLKACKKRSLRVITDLVLNHTSDIHPLFEESRRASPGSPERNFYVWSDTPDRYTEARIIFKDFEGSNWTWDPVAKAYYWHRFYSHQPDLNYDSPFVRQMIFDTVDFWLGMGVDGLRLDAVPYLFEREGTTCENLPETHAFLRDLRRHTDENFPECLLLAEANQWPEDAAAYFGDGDECHMAFHFPLMPRLFMANRMEDSFPVINILEQTPEIPPPCQWAIFLRNHDELTLEMVREEERDYMYQVYGHDSEMRINLGIRRRLAPLLMNDRRRIELMNALLFSIPGTPVIYYGDEIGMGEDLRLGDRNGVRTPMQWNEGKNAGFSEADPEQLYLPLVTNKQYHYEFLNVEEQESNTASLLWWMRNVISIRKRSKALTEGLLRFLYPANRHVLAFLREADGESALVVANLSRFAQSVELRLEDFCGFTPVEMVGNARFPTVGTGLYSISLTPYGFYWFVLEPAKSPRPLHDGEQPDSYARTVEVSEPETVLAWENRDQLAHILVQFLQSVSGDSSRPVTRAEVIDLIPLGDARTAAAVIEIFFPGGDPEVQILPLALIEDTAGMAVSPRASEIIVATLAGANGETSLLCGGTHSGLASSTLLQIVSQGLSIRTAAGRFIGHLVGPWVGGISEDKVCLVAVPQREAQRNISVVYGGLFVLKLYRRLEGGPNPDLEVVRYLFEHAAFGNVAPAAGYLEYCREGEEPVITGVLHAYVASQKTFWQHSLDHLALFFERVMSGPQKIPPEVPAHPLDLETGETTEAADLIQTYFDDTRLLARRTAELHLALSGQSDDPAFTPEDFDSFYLRGEYHGLTGTAHNVMRTLRRQQHELPADAQGEAQAVLDLESQIDPVFRNLLTITRPGLRMRVHGNLQLDHVLHTGDDLVFIDFEGDSSRPLYERRLKRSPLYDVAGVLRSFHYAAIGASFRKIPGMSARDRDSKRIEGWAQYWYVHVTSTFLQEYRSRMGAANVLPDTEDDLRHLIDVHLVGLALYQVHYELNNRPEWLSVALRGLLHTVLYQAEPVVEADDEDAGKNLASY